MSRPEGSKPPDLYYDADESRKYDSSSRMNNIQTEITRLNIYNYKLINQSNLLKYSSIRRVLEMLDLPTTHPCLILDVGNLIY
jgi:hypothetical protein